jgi:preprotein translocase subunit SecD
MKSLWLIATVLAGTIVLESAPAIAEDIALSLVNPNGRIDIPAGAITRVEASATIAFRNAETKEIVEHPDPHVELCFSEEIRQQVCQLTQRIVDEPPAVVIDYETVTKPIVREPICRRPCFSISTADLAEAKAPAQRVRDGTNRACAPPS